ncbi:two-component system C4-dicarboxylate transport response regulator DctD [Inhella inkyongensis]|uniref:Two-component system C4-dicarboxylate transport response regulator DctD n=1 Tax=Inhella inkyongensis TaxID=392593 RepID=A0A840S964_9BURK|nr:sigma-54 dependent transcriptional regulator [Inhella inkyongensis]MBB5206183.1 two-component system C4-dicarboxylate transport response regulator DctD [Inhella inkyongensis]
MFEGFEVLYVEDDPQVRESLVQTLELAGLNVRAFESAESLLAGFVPGRPVVAVSDVRLPGMDGLALLERLQLLDPSLPVVLVTGHGDVAMAVRAMRIGAYDFIEKPFTPERFVDTVQRAIEKRLLRAKVDELREQLQAKSGIEAALLGRSPGMEQVRARILRLAGTNADVMILGETGTGKELVARCLHDHSPRRDRHFVAINCGGLPETLFESELLGHESGAFTSAAKRRIGKLEHANGGTLLLDEIETMPIALQIKLLRVLQERKLERLGSNEEVKLDVRVVAATKSDLLALSDEGKFRADLYYRLNVAVLELPPLRQRREDIPLLFQHFCAQAAERYACPLPELHPAKLRELMGHDWPGNVREIRNAADRYVLEGGSDLVIPGADAALTLAQQVELVEKALIEQALMRQGGNVQRVIESLSVPKKTLYDKLHRHGIQLERFRSGG